MKRRSDSNPPPSDEIPETEDFDPYAPPPELGEASEPSGRQAKSRSPRAASDGDVELDFGLGEAPPPARRPIPRVAIAVAVVVVVAVALFAYRSVSRRKAMRVAMAQAELDVRFDTHDGYRKAAAILAPFADRDPLEAGSLRAFALGMLATDYRDAAAGEEADALLVKPERADPIPRWANLARAALALGKGEAGTAMTAASRVPGDPVAGTLEGRIALSAGNLEAAVEPLHTAAAAEPPLPAALAVHGDVVRRARRDARAAHAAYSRALASSGEHVNARAAFGLAKLALMGQVPPAEASTPLEKLAADAEAGANERARAALHLAALAIRAGDRTRATAILDGAGLDAEARAWAQRAAALEADTGRVYRAVIGAPPSLLSASDDDPPELQPVTIAPAVAEPKAEPAPKPAAKVTKATAKKPAPKATTTRKKPAAKKGAKRPARH